MSTNNIPPRLSPEAFEELKEICQDEIKRTMSDEEIHTMGINLLKLFDILVAHLPKKLAPLAEEKQIQVSDQEFKALKYIHHSIYHDKKQPTVRGITRALGLHSSRSGFRMLKVLLEMGFIHRDQEGTINMRENVAGCDTTLVY
jgi:hypothetical protein